MTADRVAVRAGVSVLAPLLVLDAGDRLEMAVFGRTMRSRWWRSRHLAVPVPAGPAVGHLTRGRHRS